MCALCIRPPAVALRHGGKMHLNEYEWILLSRHGTGSPGQWVIWVIFTVWVTGSPGHHYDPVCDPVFFILRHRFVVCSLPYVYPTTSDETVGCLVSALCTAVSIRSSILSCVLHKPRLKAFRKRELILALSLWDNWPAKEGRVYVTTDSTIAVKITCNASCITRQTLIF